MIGVTSIVQGFGLAGMFASRVFLPMFAAAMTMRFGPEIGLIDDWGLLAGVTPHAAPTWFTEDWTLIALGVLAAAELFAHKSSDARMLLTYVDQYGKPVAALLTYVGIFSVADRAFVDSVVMAGDTGVYLIGLCVAAGTFVVASAHNALLGSVIELDEDDDSGVMKLFSYGQDLWSVFGVFFLILFPIVMAVLIALVIGMIFLLRKRAQVREERSKLPCGSCGEPMYRGAMVCGSCGAANPKPCTINWLGASTDRPVFNTAQHPMMLVSKKRCRRCATRLEKRSPHQACPTCHAQPFEDAEFVAAYQRMVDGRVGTVMAVCLLLSFVPIFGLIPGVIYYRMALVGPYRRYVSRGRTFLLRWGIRVLFFFLIMLQWVPTLGMIVVPLMAMISHSAYRGAFFSALNRGDRSRAAVASAATA